MFDIGASELLVIVVVAIIVIGPKDMPLALRTAGRWIGKMRRISGHFRSGLDTMIREAEMEDMEKKWREQNAAIMTAHPGDGLDAESVAPVSGVSAEPLLADSYAMRESADARAESRSSAAQQSAANQPAEKIGPPPPP